MTEYQIFGKQFNFENYELLLEDKNGLPLKRD